MGDHMVGVKITTTSHLPLITVPHIHQHAFLSPGQMILVKLSLKIEAIEEEGMAKGQLKGAMVHPFHLYI